MKVKSTVEETNTQQENSTKPKQVNSKIYFFVIAIVALLMTNIYFYVKYKSSGEKLYTVALQKENLQIEVDRIEAELDLLNNTSVEDLPADLKNDEAAARQIINDLRTALDNSEITEKQIENARNQINQLKQNVNKIKSNVDELRIQNELLKKENEALSAVIDEKNNQVQKLREDNSQLHSKIGVASSIKVSNIHVNGIERNRKGEISLETKAKRVEDLQIKFTLADNPLARQGSKEIFVRVIDPQGNLITANNNVFQVHGDKLQYTFKEVINFTNKGEEYELYWRDSDKFKKGAYTVLLYADESIMGRSSLVLK